MSAFLNHPVQWPPLVTRAPAPLLRLEVLGEPPQQQTALKKSLQRAAWYGWGRLESSLQQGNLHTNHRAGQPLHIPGAPPVRGHLGNKKAKAPGEKKARAKQLYKEEKSRTGTNSNPLPTQLPPPHHLFITCPALPGHAQCLLPAP